MTGFRAVWLVTAQVYHPNIDMEGNVCLNILRKDWSPVLSLYAVIHGLLYLFNEPEPNDPLNHGTSCCALQRMQCFSRCGHSDPACNVVVGGACRCLTVRSLSLSVARRGGSAVTGQRRGLQAQGRP